MYTRKLKVEVSRNTCAHIHWDTEDPINTKIATMTIAIGDADLASELVKRWNAYPIHRKALQDIEAQLHNGETAEDDGETVRMVRDHDGDYLSCLTDLGDIALVALDEQSPDPNAPKPYTVVVRFEDDDAPEANNTYTLEGVFATDPAMAGRVAIDSLIEERGLDPAPEEMDTWRTEYKAIAIYEGHLTNLAE